MDYQKKYLKYKQKYLELKNQIGGNKTYNEIIAELKGKNKYDEWVSKGSIFGIQTPSMGRTAPIYVYTNMDNIKVGVGMISNVYEEGRNNIPVFDFISKQEGEQQDQNYRSTDLKGRTTYLNY